jgi:hypothetical protein
MNYCNFFQKARSILNKRAELFIAWFKVVGIILFLILNPEPYTLNQHVRF